MTKPRSRSRRADAPADAPQPARPRPTRARTGPVRAAGKKPAPAALKAAPGKKAALRNKTVVPVPALTKEQSSQRLVEVMGDQLRPLCRVIERVGDFGTDVDAVLGHLAVLASRPRRATLAGQERAWLLTALLRLLGASVAEPDPRRLPRLRKARQSPGRIEIRPERLQRLQDALQGISRPERASVVLVVQEGLSLEQASRVLGHSRQEFAEAYSDALEALDDELIETLMGH